MSIKFKVVQRKNPRDLEAPAKYYATSVPQEKLDLNDLADLMADGSTVRRNDIYAVLVGLVDSMKRQLRQGHMIKLNDLGSFAINVSAEGKEKRKKYWEPPLKNQELFSVLPK
ncbi:hypothetical protein UJ101_01714 [Flavobacteriaceae bacterium UJ101]|nr:hypothetical protein UJ101_01714 [Flavobacteriaceae bacterium UJ101]